MSDKITPIEALNLIIDQLQEQLDLKEEPSLTSDTVKVFLINP